MLVADSASWECDVFPAWRRAAGNAERPNSDVWGKLPGGIIWFRAKIEPCDVRSLYVIGSGDWKEVYRSYRLVDIATDRSSGGDDHGHHQKIQALQHRLSAGDTFEPLILVSCSKQGPFVIIDGNHRAVASYRLGHLFTTPIFIGLHPNVREFVWFKLAVQD